MKPQYQRIIEQGRGDCFAACLASILELSRDQVPNFREMSVARDVPMVELVNEWLAPRGLAILYLTPWEGEGTWHWLQCWCILTMPSQLFPDGKHSVVGKLEKEGRGITLRIVHDPNPRNVPYGADVMPERIGLLIHTGM